MPKVTIEVTPEKLAEILCDLSPDEFKEVLARLAGRVEGQEWMRLAESAFHEWLAEPDLYGDDQPTRRCRPLQIPLLTMAKVKETVVNLVPR